MSRRPLIDINVLLDVLARREPFVADALGVWTAAESGRIQAMVCADSFTTIHYLVRRASSHQKAMRAMRLIREVFDVAAVDDGVIERAIESPLGDFEDAVQYESAIWARADCIVTRDVDDFRTAKLPVLTPAGFCAALHES